MNELEEQLDLLDEQLETYSPFQRWAIYVGSAAGILLMGWMFYLSDTLDNLNALQTQNEELVRQLGENSPESYRAKIEQKTLAIRREEAKNGELLMQKEALLAEMSAQSGLIFDNRRYAQLLQNLLAHSVRLGLKIELMESEESDKTFFGKIREFKKMSVTGTGNFPAIAAFLSHIEGQNTLVQIESLKVYTDGEKPRFEAVILFMGVAL